MCDPARERMATLVESADMGTLGSASNITASHTSSSLSHHFVDSKFYLLVVIGEIVTEDHLKCAIADIEKGKRERMEMMVQQSWTDRPLLCQVAVLS